MQPKSTSTSKSISSPYQRPGGSSVLNRRRSWSEENAIREEDSSMMSNSENYDNPGEENERLPRGSQQHHFEAYAPPPTHVVRTGPLYFALLTLVFFFTMPMFFMNVTSTRRIPRPPSLDGDPNTHLKHGHGVPMTGEGEEQQHYMGRPLSDSIPSCTEVSSQAWTATERAEEWVGNHSIIPLFRMERDLIRIPANGTLTMKRSLLGKEEARCYFVQVMHSPHFPHAMQQLYRCWSYFRANQGKIPVLLYPEGHPRFPRVGTEQVVSSGAEKSEAEKTAEKRRRNVNERRKASFKFLEGFLGSLENNFHVVLRPVNLSHQSEEIAGAVTFVNGSDAAAGYGMIPEDARALVKGILSPPPPPSSLFLGLKRSNEGCSCTKSSRPRLAILNRKGHREVLNAEQLANALLHALGLEVELFYFEGVGFLGQVSFFARTDILISPHGAQLTGIPFMRHCGSVLEIFPPDYCMPYFFGSLAVSSGLDHSFLALGSAPCRLAGVGGAPGLRGVARSVPLCPPIDVLVDAARVMVQRWKQCCCKT